MLNNEVDERECVALCKSTFSSCMKSAIHCMNELGASANDPYVAALLECAEQCYTCMSFTNPGSQLQQEAFLASLEKCDRVVKLCGEIDDSRLRECCALCQETAEALSQYRVTA